MNFSKKLRWFTLVEMLIVIVIIWVLAAALIPRLTSVKWRANDVARKADLQQVATAIVSYSMDKWKYPSTWTTSVENLDLKKYVTVMPKDPTSSYVFPEYPISTAAWNVVNTWQYIYVSITKWWNANKWFALISRAETEWWANWLYLWWSTLTWWKKIDSNTTTEEIVPCALMTQSDTATEQIIPGRECTYKLDSALRYIIAR